MLGNIKYIEDILNNKEFSELNVETFVALQDTFTQFQQIKANLTAMGYSFPIYKGHLSKLDSLSEALNKIDAYSKNIDMEEMCNDLKTNSNDLKSNFNENKEDLYKVIGDLANHYSE